MAAKQPTSFALTARAKALLKLIADHEKRSQANMLEILIEEKAAALKIKVMVK